MYNGPGNLERSEVQTGQCQTVVGGGMRKKVPQMGLDGSMDVLDCLILVRLVENLIASQTSSLTILRCTKDRLIGLDLPLPDAPLQSVVTGYFHFHLLGAMALEIPNSKRASSDYVIDN
ncbi:hypothetical protein ACH5RR_019591 [Cinchona calisaya]|uniref:Uncharacterized protein n=1 Tax=Cinchona calisaya TaxID=153742 RepID=A0ABD2ZPU5_9GENT